MNRKRSQLIAMISAWAVLMLAAAPAEQAQGASPTAKEGHAQSSPILKQPVIQGSSTPAAASGEPVPGMRTVRLASAPGQPWQVQPANRESR